jgi:hypothetical protein
MRWLMLVLLVLGTVLTFTAKSTGVLSAGLVMGIVGFFGLVFAFAADRVSSSARPETSMLAPEDLAAMRARQSGAKPRPVAAAPAKPAPLAPVRPVVASPKAPPPPAGGAAS